MDRKFADLCEKVMQFILDTYPEFCTYKGVKNRKPDELDSFSLDFYEGRKKFYSSILNELSTIPMSELSEDNQISASVLDDMLSQPLKGQAIKNHYMPFNHVEGIDFFFCFYTLPRIKFTGEKSYEDYCSRLKAFARQESILIDESIVLMKEGLKEDIVEHSLIREPLATRLKSDVDSDLEDLQVFKPFKEIPESIPAPTREALYENGKQIVEQYYKKSIAKVLDFLEKEYFSRLATNMSINRLPGRADSYSAFLQYYCDLDISPMELHELGKREVNKLTDQLKTVMAKAKFEGSPKEFVSHMESKKDMYFDDLDDMLPYCRRIVTEKIKPKLGSLFNEFHDFPFDIEAKKSKSSSRGVYNAPSADGSKPGVFTLWVSSDVAKFELTPLLMHELFPGHHLQACVIQENKSLPMFRILKDDRRYFEAPGRISMYAAYTEGWGLYSEYLGLELGIYDDPYDEYGYLFCNFTRAARIVIDTGIHILGWGEEEVRDYLNEYAPIATQSISEIPRFVVWPGQGCAYTFGFLKIKELRAKAEKALGDRFDLRQFHQECLECGAVSLQTLEKIIDMYINRVKRSA